jgi:hypothetical protein
MDSIVVFLPGALVCPVLAGRTVTVSLRILRNPIIIVLADVLDNRKYHRGSRGRKNHSMHLDGPHEKFPFQSLRYCRRHMCCEEQTCDSLYFDVFQHGLPSLTSGVLSFVSND